MDLLSELQTLNMGGEYSPGARLLLSPMPKVQHRRQSVTLRPSGSKCTRQVFHDNSRDTMVIDTLAGIIRMGGGSGIHEIIQERLAAVPEWEGFSAEVVLDRDPVRGYADGIYWHNNQKYILEIKTIKAFAWEHLKAPYDDHLWQASMYVWAARADKAHIMYFPREVFNKTAFEQPLKEFFIEPNLEDVERRLAMAKKALQSFKVPPAYDLVNDRPIMDPGNEPVCRWCAARSLCLKGWGGRNAQP